MIIYGWGKDLNKLAYAGLEKCPQCKNYGHFWICENASYASLYWIKLAKWNKKVFYMCELCQNGFEIDAAKKDNVLRDTVAIPAHDQVIEMWNQYHARMIRATEWAEENGTDLGQALVRSIEKTSQRMEETYSPAHIAYVYARFVAWLQDDDKAD